MSKHLKDFALGKKRGLVVDVRDGNFEGALNMLRKKMNKEGILKELKKRERYKKPSVAKREKHVEALRRLKKAKFEKEQSE